MCAILLTLRLCEDHTPGLCGLFVVYPHPSLPLPPPPPPLTLFPPSLPSPLPASLWHTRRRREVIDLWSVLSKKSTLVIKFYKEVGQWGRDGVWCRDVNRRGRDEGGGVRRREGQRLVLKRNCSAITYPVRNVHPARGGGEGVGGERGAFALQRGGSRRASHFCFISYLISIIIILSSITSTI